MKSRPALTLLESFPHPDFVLESNRVDIKNHLMTSTRKSISEKSFSKSGSNH